MDRGILQVVGHKGVGGKAPFGGYDRQIATPGGGIDHRAHPFIVRCHDLRVNIGVDAYGIDQTGKAVVKTSLQKAKVQHRLTHLVA
jgi:hypothetical protein